MNFLLLLLPLLTSCQAPRPEPDYEDMRWEELCEFDYPGCEKKARRFNKMGDEFCICLDGPSKPPRASKKSK